MYPKQGAIFCQFTEEYVICQFKTLESTKNVPLGNLYFMKICCLLIFSNTVFASADAAYVLAYSIILLTTDLHNSQVNSINFLLVLREVLVSCSFFISNIEVYIYIYKRNLQ